MYFRKIFTFMFFSAILTFCLGDEEADLKLREEFKGLEGVAGGYRDTCLKESSTEIDSLKDYKNNDDIPENDLCFYKCFYEKIGFIDENGRIQIDLLVDVPAGQGFTKEQVAVIKPCIEGLDDINTCADLRAAGKCFE